MLYYKGWSFSQIAEALLLSEDVVRRHFNEYKAWKKLKPEGEGSVEKLSAEQSEHLREHLICHTYLYVKDIIAHVQSTFGINYSVAGRRNWLQRHDFSYKKPSIVSGKANEQAQKAWLAEYQKLKLNLPESETVCFMDGVHSTHNV